MTSGPAQPPDETGSTPPPPPPPLAASPLTAAFAAAGAHTAAPAPASVGVAEPPTPTADVPGAPSSTFLAGMWLGIIGLILGGIGLALPFAPFDTFDVRAGIAWVFALPGLLFGILGCTGRRRGNGFGAAGTIVSGVALGLAIVLLIVDSRANLAYKSPGDHTHEILSKELDVRFGQQRVDPKSGTVYTAVLFHNKGSALADYTVSLHISNNGKTCDTTASADQLAPGASYQQDVASCAVIREEPVSDLAIEVTAVKKG